MDPSKYVDGLNRDSRCALATVLCDMHTLLYERGKAGDTRDVAPDCRAQACAAGLDPEMTVAVLLFWLAECH